RSDEVLTMPTTHPAKNHLPSPPSPATEPSGQKPGSSAGAAPSGKAPRKRKRAKEDVPPAEKPALDPTPGKLNVESFLVPVGQEVAVTPTKQTVITVKMMPKSAFSK